MEEGQREMLVRHGKGGDDRRTMLPEAIREGLQAHLEKIRRLHERDRRAGRGEVRLPEALDRKLPKASKEWRWQGAFPSARLSKDPRSDWQGRHPLHLGPVIRAMTQACRAAGLAIGRRFIRYGTRSRRICWRTGRTSGRSRNCWGDKSVETTMIYTHVLNRGGRGVTNPLDRG